MSLTTIAKLGGHWLPTVEAADKNAFWGQINQSSSLAQKSPELALSSMASRIGQFAKAAVEGFSNQQKPSDLNMGAQPIQIQKLPSVQEISTSRVGGEKKSL